MIAKFVDELAVIQSPGTTALSKLLAIVAQDQPYRDLYSAGYPFGLIIRRGCGPSEVFANIAENASARA